LFLDSTFKHCTHCTCRIDIARLHLSTQTWTYRNHNTRYPFIQWATKANSQLFTKRVLLWNTKAL
jgi:hypothetical protein